MNAAKKIILLLWFIVASLATASALTPGATETRVGQKSFASHETHQAEASQPLDLRQANATCGYELAPESLLAAKGGRTPLWRAVKPEELADIHAQGIFRNLGSAEGKYFSTTAEGAASYAKQAVKGFGDPPYTLIETEVPNNLLPPSVLVDRNVPAVVLPNNVLPNLKPQVLDYFPVPPR